MSEQNFEAAAPTEQSLIESAEVAAPAVRKQGMNIYTVMLVISFVSLVIGTIILFMEYSKFGGWNTNSAKPQTSANPIERIDQDFFV